MNENFIIVLFKDKVKKKIINKFVTKDKAEKYFTNLIEKSNKVIFEKQYENCKKCSFEIALLSKDKSTDVKYYRDELGRQVKLKLDNDDYVISKLEKYNIEEYLMDFQFKKKISTTKFIEKYLSSNGIKLVSKLNNKIVVQNDDKFDMFTLKNEYDSERLIDSLSNYMVKNKRVDCLLVKDVSTVQRKYLYEILVDKGYDKKYLFRTSTRLPI